MSSPTRLRVFVAAGRVGECRGRFAAEFFDANNVIANLDLVDVVVRIGVREEELQDQRLIRFDFKNRGRDPAAGGRIRVRRGRHFLPSLSDDAQIDPGTSMATKASTAAASIDKIVMTLDAVHLAMFVVRKVHLHGAGPSQEGLAQDQ